MKKDMYEIYLLEIRQGLRETEEHFRAQPCTDLVRFRELIKIKSLVQQALIDFRTGRGERNELFINFMGG